MENVSEVSQAKTKNNFIFGMSGIIVGLLFFAVVLLGFDYFGIISLSSLYLKQTMPAKKIVREVPRNSGFITSSQNMENLPIGYLKIFDDKAAFKLIVIISRVYLLNDIVYVEINYPNKLNKIIDKKIIIYDKNKKTTARFFLNIQDSAYFDPTSDSYKVEVLTDKDKILKELNNYLKKPIILFMTLDKSDKDLKDYISCNQEWLDSLINVTKSSECEPFVNQIYVRKN
jgi:hypothetical protein